MAMTARGGFNEPDTEPGLAGKLRHLAVGAELHSKGARMFMIHMRPFGIVIEATDRSIVRVIKTSLLIQFDELDEKLEHGRVKMILREIDAALDREIRRAE